MRRSHRGNVWGGVALLCFLAHLWVPHPKTQRRGLGAAQGEQWGQRGGFGPQQRGVFLSILFLPSAELLVVVVVLFDRLLVGGTVFHKELKSYIKCIVLYVSHLRTMKAVAGTQIPLQIDLL